MALYIALRDHPPPRLTAERAATLSKELRSGKASQLRDAVAVPRGIALDPAGIKALAKRSFVIDPRSFRRVGSDTASVAVRLRGAHRVVQRWEVLLVYSNGLWKLDDTRRVRA